MLLIEWYDLVHIMYIDLQDRPLNLAAIIDVMVMRRFPPLLVLLLNL
jgi:hypothetical protein